MDPAGGGCVNAGDAMFSTYYCCQEATKALSSHIRLAEFYEFGPNEDSLKCDNRSLLPHMFQCASIEVLQPTIRKCALIADASDPFVLLRKWTPRLWDNTGFKNKIKAQWWLVARSWSGFQREDKAPPPCHVIRPLETLDSPDNLLRPSHTGGKSCNGKLLPTSSIEVQEV